MSHSTEIISQDKTDEAIKEIFKSILSRYRSGSYIHSPDWIKNRKAAINPINKNDNKCF